MSKGLTSIFVIGTLAFGIFFFKNQEKQETIPVRLSIGEKSWSIIGIADTDEARQQGLSNRKKLDPGTGLLFSFPQAGQYSFWMKDMNFPLDIVFIRQNDEVDSVARGRSPGDLTLISPKEPIIHVFEVNAGEGEEIRAGDRVRWE